jgi:hypothetical protein
MATAPRTAAKLAADSKKLSGTLLCSAFRRIARLPVHDERQKYCKSELKDAEYYQ